MIKIFVFITAILLVNASEADLVDPILLKELGLDYTETVYSGYLSVNDDGSA